MERPAIGIVVPRMTGYAIISAVHGMEQILESRGYQVIITQLEESGEPDAGIARLLTEQGVRGVIASLPAEKGNVHQFSAFIRHGVPVVFFDQIKRTEETSSVVIDYHCCGWMAAEHLVRQGCRRIAIFTPDVRLGANRRRYEGFLQGLRIFGIPFSDELRIVGCMDEEGGARAAARLIAMDPMPDAVFVTNDLAAAVCMYKLEEAGIRVPEDLAIVGFNNEPLARLVRPGLTTIDYPGGEIGRIAAESLLEQMSGGFALAEPHTMIVPARLIVRHSSLRVNTAEFFSID